MELVEARSEVLTGCRSACIQEAIPGIRKDGVVEPCLYRVPRSGSQDRGSSFVTVVLVMGRILVIPGMGVNGIRTSE